MAFGRYENHYWALCMSVYVKKMQEVTKKEKFCQGRHEKIQYSINFVLDDPHSYLPS